MLNGLKVTSCQSWRSYKKVCHTAHRTSRGGPGSNHSQILMAGNFAALWPRDAKFSALKDLNLFKILWKVQEASSILRVGFALSNWPHFNSIYLLRVSSLTGIAVYGVKILLGFPRKSTVFMTYAEIWSSNLN